MPRVLVSIVLALVVALSAPAQEDQAFTEHVQAMRALIEKGAFDPAEMFPHLQATVAGESDPERLRLIDTVFGEFIRGYIEDHFITPDNIMEHAPFLRCCGLLRRIGEGIPPTGMIAASAFSEFLLPFVRKNLDSYAKLTDHQLAMIQEVIRMSTERDATFGTLAMPEVAWGNYRGNLFAQVLASAYACQGDEVAKEFLHTELSGLLAVCRPLNDERIELYKAAFKSGDPLTKEERAARERDYDKKCLELRRALVPVQLFLDACYPASLRLLPELIAEVKSATKALKGLIADKIDGKLMNVK